MHKLVQYFQMMCISKHCHEVTGFLLWIGTYCTSRVVQQRSRVKDLFSLVGYDDSCLAAIRHVKSTIRVVQPRPNILSHSVLFPEKKRRLQRGLSTKGLQKCHEHLFSSRWQDEELFQDECFAWFREWSSAPDPHHSLYDGRLFEQLTPTRQKPTKWIHRIGCAEKLRPSYLFYRVFHPDSIKVFERTRCRVAEYFSSKCVKT